MNTPPLKEAKLDRQYIDTLLYKWGHPMLTTSKNHPGLSKGYSKEDLITEIITYHQDEARYTAGILKLLSVYTIDLEKILSALDSEQEHYYFQYLLQAAISPENKELLSEKKKREYIQFFKKLEHMQQYKYYIEHVRRATHTLLKPKKNTVLQNLKKTHPSN